MILLLLSFSRFCYLNASLSLGCVSVSVTSPDCFVFQAYGQSFLQPDIAVFKQNLESLEALNYKWKLYSKVRHSFFSLSEIEWVIFDSHTKEICEYVMISVRPFVPYMANTSTLAFTPRLFK